MSVRGRWDPPPILATMMLPGVIGWSFPTSGTLSTRGGDLLKSPPPPPTRAPTSFWFANTGEVQDPLPTPHLARR